jgi:transcriptional regulator
MRQNPSFAVTDTMELRRVIEANPWATLAATGPDGVVASHYPVLLSDDRDDLTVVGHVGRPDDVLLSLGTSELTVIVQGPHGYISPSWYAPAPAVPTWNFVAVHLSGVAELMTDDENLRTLERLVTRFESLLPEPRLMWSPPNDPEYVQRLAAGTVGFRLTPARVVAKRKLSQNRPASDVDRIIDRLEGDGPFAQPALAAEMRRARDARLTP